MKRTLSSLMTSLWMVVALTAASGLAACGSSEPTGNEDAAAMQSAVAKDVRLEEFQQLMAQEGALLIDVRTEGEWDAGHIEGAAFINFQSPDFSDRMAALPTDRPVLLYCASGNRSGKAMAILNRAGHPEIYNLLGGIRAWQGAGNEVVHTPAVEIQ